MLLEPSGVNGEVPSSGFSYPARRPGHNQRIPFPARPSKLSSVALRLFPFALPLRHLRLGRHPSHRHCLPLPFRNHLRSFRRNRPRLPHHRRPAHFFHHFRPHSTLAHLLLFDCPHHLPEQLFPSLQRLLRRTLSSRMPLLAHAPLSLGPEAP